MPTGRKLTFSLSKGFSVMKTYTLHWAPDGSTCIATVTAKTPSAAVRKAPLPYRRFLGEIYAKEV